MQLKNAKIIITGGASGFGYRLALGLAPKVAHVFVIDVNAEQLSKNEYSENVTAIVCDLTLIDQVEQVAKTIFNDNGGANVLINNAGIIHSEPLVNLLQRPDKKHSISNWLKVINVNLNAVFYMTACIAEQMITKKSAGVIINISSISAQGNIGQSAYSASKAAVEALAKTWSKELGMFKIRCASIAPGFFDTSSTRDSLNEHMLAKWKKNVPTNTLGNPDELMMAVEFIIQNEYYNGKTLSLDGGLTL